MDREQGLTMIEVLVTFVILAVGVLGIVSLLTTSKTSEFEAAQRARAVTLADTMVEKIRANPRALSTDYTDPNKPGEPILPAFTDLSTAPAEPSPNCLSVDCRPAELAVHDLWNWKRSLVGAPVTVVEGGATVAAAALNEVTACILFTPFDGKPNTGLVEVLVQWQGVRETSDAIEVGQAACGGLSPGTDPRRRAVRVSTFTVDQADII